MTVHSGVHHPWAVACTVRPRCGCGAASKVASRAEAIEHTWPARVGSPDAGCRILLPMPFDRRVWQETLALDTAGYEAHIICPRTEKYPRRREFLDGICKVPRQADCVMATMRTRHLSLASATPGSANSYSGSPRN
jgi:hypothetical protein